MEETTEDIQVDPRPIEDLLKLDTFQGMTDNEITSIIDYSVKRAAQDAAHAVRMEEIEARSERDIKSWEALKATGDALLASASMPTTFEKVSDPDA